MGKKNKIKKKKNKDDKINLLSNKMQAISRMLTIFVERHTRYTEWNKSIK
jgi:hypothetical protein